MNFISKLRLLTVRGWYADLRLSVGLLLLVTAPAVLAEPRTALVIGNSTYAGAPLKNAGNDAQDIAAKLRELGFQVIERVNADRQTMRQALRDFEQQLRQQRGVGLFYYAGHGVQINGRNYLIPVGADIRQEFEVPDESLDADAALRAMESAGNDLNILILDACRNNPFARSFGVSSRGLARMDGPAGTFIAYATAPGSVSQDGNSRNSPYTRSLLAAMSKPGLNLEQVFKQVLVAVERETGGNQIPWVASSLRGDFFFVQANAAPLVAPSGSAESPPPTIPPVAAAQPPTSLAAPSGPAEFPSPTVPPVAAANPPTSAPAPTEPETAEPPLTRAPQSAAPPAADPDRPAVAPLEPDMVTAPSAGFAIGRHAVSSAEYQRFVEATGRIAPPLSSASRNDPVTVTWKEALNYANWLSRQTGYNYRLPTEAEWDYAARTGVGVYDPSGQMREWTCSEYQQSYQGQEQHCVTRSPAAVAVRGGVWRAGADPLNADLGFRLIREF